jgi:hypothetical protein
MIITFVSFLKIMFQIHTDVKQIMNDNLQCMIITFVSFLKIMFQIHTDVYLFNII